jgi:hypothetical protein
MAKVRGAKQRITAFLQAKGLDASEIKDAFDELDSADVDLDSLAAQVVDATTKNQQWNQWYQEVAPEVSNAMQERDALKARIAQLEAAGVRLSDSPGLSAGASHAAAAVAQGQYVSPADLDRYRNELTAATSSVMKQLTKVSMRHFKEFNEEADLDEIERLVAERGYSVEDAYNTWVQPKQEERRKKDTEEQIQRGIQEGLQTELSKQGIRRTRRRVDDVEPAPLDKPAPSDGQLREAFLEDLSNDVTH